MRPVYVKSIARHLQYQVLYRFFDFVNQWFAIAVLWLYIGAFLLGFGMLFIMPQITLMLLFLGLVGLGLAGLTAGLLHATQRTLARRSLSGGLCPACGGRAPLPLSNAEHHRECSDCHRQFTPDGTAISHDPRQLSDQPA